MFLTLYMSKNLSKITNDGHETTERQGYFRGMYNTLFIKNKLYIFSMPQKPQKVINPTEVFK